MSRLFSVIAGQADATFSIGDAEFMAAPLTISEYAVYKSLGKEMDAEAEFWAEKLRSRIRGTKPDPATITTEWVMDNVPMSLLPTLAHVMIYGELPGPGENTKAP